MERLKIYSLKFIVLTSLLGVMVSADVKAQQFFSYTQYMQNLTYVNPAYALLDKNGSVNTLVKKQWVGIDGAPSTYMFNGSLPIENIGGTIGINIMNDNFAVEHLTKINAFFAKSIQLTEQDYLSVSLIAGMRQYVANYSTLDPNDIQFRNDVRETKPNVGFGVMYYSDNYYLGVSVPELSIRSLGNASINNDNKYFRNHYYFSGAYIATVAEDIKIKPATLVTYTRGLTTLADFSATMYLKDTFGIGLNYRTNRQTAGIFSIHLDDIKIGYSYQFGTSVSNVSGFSNATHEITIGYRFGKNLAQHQLL